MKRKFLSLVLSLSLLLGMTMALPAMADEEKTEPIITNGGFEEVADDGLSPIGWTGGTIMPSNTETGNLSYSGDGFLYLEAGKGTYCSTFKLEPDTDYILKFWSRTSVADGGSFDLRFRSGGKPYNESVPDYVNGEHLYQESFGSANEAPAEEGAVDGRFQWEEQSFSFTTPSKTDGGTITFSAAATETYFCLDDISLTPSGREPNLVRNGYLTTFKNGGTRPSGWTWSVPASDIVTYLMLTSGDMRARFTANSGYYRGPVAVPAGRYKLSFEWANHSGARDRAPSIYMNFDGINTGFTDAWYKAQNTHAYGVKQTYEYYFTVAPGAEGIKDFRVEPGLSGTSTVSDLYNIRIWRDEAGVQYGKTATGTIAVTNTLSQDWYMPITRISEADKNTDETAYVVLPKAHYIPTTTETENFTMINALYRTYEGGRRIIEGITFANGQATGGLVANANGSMEVPVLTGEEDYTYEIHSFIWSGAGTMQPKAAVSTISY